MNSAHVQSIHALEDLRAAFAQFGSDAREALDGADHELARTLEWLVERQTHWRREIERRENDVAHAMTALNWCLASGDAEHPPVCTAQEAALVAARRELKKGQEELLNVQRWTKAVQEAATQYRRQSGRLAAALEKDVSNARATISWKINELQGYQSVALPGGVFSRSWGGTTSAGPGRTPAVSSGSTGVPGQDRHPVAEPASALQVREVPISQVDQSDSYVHGPEDFHKGTSPEEMADWYRKWQSVVRPAVQRGSGPDYFTELDNQFGLDPVHGYRAVYDIFYGERNAIALNWTGDRYVVINGYHRLYIATRLGFQSVPALVLGGP